MDLWRQVQLLYKSLLSSSEEKKLKESTEVKIDTNDTRSKTEALLNEEIQQQKYIESQPKIVVKEENEMELPPKEIVMTKCLDEEFTCDEFTVNISRRNTIPRSRRSNCRRYLNDQMWELRRQSWAGDLHVLTEEDDEQDEQDEEEQRNEAGAESNSEEELQIDSQKQFQNYSELELYFLTL